MTGLAGGAGGGGRGRGEPCKLQLVSKLLTMLCHSHGVSRPSAGVISCNSPCIIHILAALKALEPQHHIREDRQARSGPVSVRP